MTVLKNVLSLLALLLLAVPLMGRDTLLEFKGAYFLPTNSCFKTMYSNNRALYGPELTVQLCPERDWYAFASVDYLKAHGKSSGLCSPTTVRLVPIALGLKYFIPHRFENVDFYAGLGLEIMNVRTKDCAVDVIQQLSKWGYGGVAKVGAYCYLPHNFLIDIFIDYSFLRAGSDKWCGLTDGVELLKANVSGTIFGAALGYKF